MQCKWILEETAVDGGDLRPDCQENLNLSWVSDWSVWSASSHCAQWCRLKWKPSTCSSSPPMKKQLQPHHATSWRCSLLQVKALATGASMSLLSFAGHIPRQTIAFASRPGGWHLLLHQVLNIPNVTNSDFETIASNYGPVCVMVYSWRHEACSLNFNLH